MEIPGLLLAMQGARSGSSWQCPAFQLRLPQNSTGWAEGKARPSEDWAGQSTRQACPHLAALKGSLGHEWEMLCRLQGAAWEQICHTQRAVPNQHCPGGGGPSGIMAASLC